MLTKLMMAVVGLLVLSLVLGLWLWCLEGLVVEIIRPGMSWAQVAYGVGTLATTGFWLALARPSKR